MYIICVKAYLYIFENEKRHEKYGVIMAWASPEERRK